MFITAMGLPPLTEQQDRALLALHDARWMLDSSGIRFAVTLEAREGWIRRAHLAIHAYAPTHPPAMAAQRAGVLAIALVVEAFGIQV